MARVLVIGYGNPLRRDDGFGWHVARELLTGKPRPEVEAIPCHQLTPDLAEPLSRAECVIFVDAMRHADAGKLTVQKVGEQAPCSPSFSHHASPQALLANAREWYGSSPRAAFIVSVSALDFGLGETMSSTISDLVPLAIQEIEWLSEATRDPASVGTRRAKKSLSAS